ncbi:MAG: hypothetical protein AAF371_16675 [Pseudomonadota bacterium]
MTGSRLGGAFCAALILTSATAGPASGQGYGDAPPAEFRMLEIPGGYGLDTFDRTLEELEREREFRAPVLIDERLFLPDSGGAEAGTGRVTGPRTEPGTQSRRQAESTVRSEDLVRSDAPVGPDLETRALTRMLDAYVAQPDAAYDEGRVRELLDETAGVTAGGVTTAGIARFSDQRREEYEEIAPAMPWVLETLAATRALRPDLGAEIGADPAAPGATGATGILTGAAHERLSSLEARREIARRRGLPDGVAEYIRVLPVTVDGVPVVLTPRDLERPELARLTDPLDWIKSVGPGAVPVEPFAVGPRADQVAADGTGGCGRGTSAPCFHAAVALHDSAMAQCTAIQIAPGWVVTAAHCTCSNKLNFAAIGGEVPLSGARQSGPRDRTRVVAQDAVQLFRPDGAEPPDFCTPLAEWHAMPADAPDLVARERALYRLRDIALVGLNQPLSLPEAETVAGILHPDLVARVRSVMVAGFGTNSAEAYGGRKTHFSSDLVPGACETIAVCLPDREIALLIDDGTDTCRGDSGAGVFVRLADGTLAALALTSRAANRSCGGGGIYALLADAAVIDWLEDSVPGLRVVRNEIEIAQAHLRQSN